MKITLLCAMLAFAWALSAHSAETTVKLTDVHLCCQGCVKGVETAVGKVEGVTAAVDRTEETVTLTAADAAKAQKAADALVAAGYFGKSSDPNVKVVNNTGAKDQKVASLKIEGVHLCCGKCVSVVDDAVKSVAGVKGHNATRGAKSFEVTGDFNDKEVFAALQKAGLAGTVAK